MLGLERWTSIANAAGRTTVRTAVAAPPTPPGRALKPASTIRFVALLLLLASCWAGAGNAQITPTPTKVIQFFNNTTETLYVVLQMGTRSTDEWMQANFGVGKAEILTKKWPSNKVYRIYINGLDGVPRGGSAIITVPFFTYLVSPAAAKIGVKPDLLIDWWNGGRVLVYDQFGSRAYREDYNNDLKTKGNPIVPPKSSGNLVVTCKSGDCKQLDIFAGAAVLPGNDPDQLTEYTFGDAITADGAPYPFNAKTVGYNISSVDQLYLPLAIGPAGNKLIPYIGSVEALAQFRSTLTRWLNKHPGWPLYKGFDAAHPRIPEAHTIFLDGYMPDGTYNQNGPLTRPGKDVQNLITLYNNCTGKNPPINNTCTQLQDVAAMFKNNFLDYRKLACADKKFVNTPIQALRKIYGWVPYNTGCLSGDNALIETTGVDGDAKKFNVMQNKYVSMQYNYKTVPNLEVFNPYVELIHSKTFLDMAAYAFSIDDAIGFQHYEGTGLNYAAGGTRGLANKTKLDKEKLVNISYGHPPNTTLWKSIGVCSDNANDQNLNPNFPSIDVFPPAYPCVISALNVDGNVYQLRLTKGPPNVTVTCSGMLQAAWCRMTNTLPPNKVIGASTR